MTVTKLLKFGYRLLRDSSPSPELDAELLLASCLKQSRVAILIKPTTHIPGWMIIKYLWKLWQRKIGRPVAYLTHQREFYGRIFYIDKNTLVPRPDSEILIEVAKKNITNKYNQINKVIDLGTGSGCLAITLALELPDIKVLASDISTRAIRVAQKNAKKYNVTDKISFKIGNLLKPFAPQEIDPQTIIIGNLPYLLRAEITKDLRYEPYKALFGGDDGLFYFKCLFKQFTEISITSRPKHLILEVSPLLIDDLNKLIKDLLPEVDFNYTKDLNNYHRIIEINVK